MANDGDIALVLSGGGAKGAFQAGVWKAMHELGLARRVRVISGTSAGALNAAAFATMPDPESTCDFWRNHVGEVATSNLRNLSVDSFRRAAENVLSGKAFPFHGLLDRGELERLIRGLMPERWPADAPEVVATTLECRGGILEELDPSSYRLTRFRIGDEADPERRLAKLVASAAIPWGFDPVEIDGNRYVDGGWDEKGGENIPVMPILEDPSGIRTVIVVRCNSADLEPEPLGVSVPPGVRLVEVRPRSPLKGLFDGLSDIVPEGKHIRDLGFLGRILADKLDNIGKQLRIWSGTFAFDRDCATNFIRQGHDDGLAALRHLRPKEKLNW